MTYSEALAQLPEGAKWSSSFGYPGEGGYVEYHRDAGGIVWLVANGTWLDFAPFNWTAKRLEPMPLPPAR